MVLSLSGNFNRSDAMIGNLVGRPVGRPIVKNYIDSFMSNSSFNSKIKDFFNNYKTLFNIKNYLSLLRKLDDVSKKIYFSEEEIGHNIYELKNLLESEKSIIESTPTNIFNIPHSPNFLKEKIFGEVEVNNHLVEKIESKIEKVVDDFKSRTTVLENKIDPDEITRKVISDLDPKLSDILYKNIYLQRKIADVQKDSDWIRESLQEKVLPSISKLDELGLKEFIENWDPSKSISENISSHGGLTELLIGMAIGSSKFRGTILGRALRLFKSGSLPKLLNRSIGMFVKGIPEKGVIGSLKSAASYGLRRGGKLVGAVLGGSIMPKGVFGILKGIKNTSPFMSTVGNVGRAGAKVAKSTVPLGRFVPKIMRRSSNIFGKVGSKIPIVGTTLSLLSTGYEALTANSEAEAKKAIGSGIGGSIGATLGGMIGAVIPIPGATLVGTMLGSYVGDKLGSWLGGMFMDYDDIIPNSLKSRPIREQINSIDTAIHTVAENKVNPFTGDLFDDVDEAKDFIDNLYKYKQKLIKEMMADAKFTKKDLKYFEKEPEAFIAYKFGVTFPETIGQILDMIKKGNVKIEEREKKESVKSIEKTDEKEKSWLDKVTDFYGEHKQAIGAVTPIVGGVMSAVSSLKSFFTGEKKENIEPITYKKKSDYSIMVQETGTKPQGRFASMEFFSKGEMLAFAKFLEEKRGIDTSKLKTIADIDKFLEKHIFEFEDDYWAFRKQYYWKKAVKALERERFDVNRAPSGFVKAVAELYRDYDERFVDNVIEKLDGEPDLETLLKIFEAEKAKVDKKVEPKKKEEEEFFSKAVSYVKGLWNKTPDVVKGVVASSIPVIGAVAGVKKVREKLKQAVDSLSGKKSSDDMLLAMVRKHETGSMKGRYDIAKDIGDKAGISFGAYQFTEKSGMVKKFLERYAEEAGGESKKIYGLYRTGHLDREQLVAFLKKAGDTPLGRKIQDELAKEKYIEPAKRLAEKFGVKDPKAVAQVVDMAINAGLGGARRTLEKAKAMGDLSAEGIARARKEYYIALAQRKPHLAKYLRGWLNRVDNNLTEAGQLFADVDVKANQDISVNTSTPEAVAQANVNQSEVNAVNVSPIKPELDKEQMVQEKESVEKIEKVAEVVKEKEVMKEGAPLVLNAKSFTEGNKGGDMYQPDFMFEGFLSGAFTRG